MSVIGAFSRLLSTVASTLYSRKEFVMRGARITGMRIRGFAAWLAVLALAWFVFAFQPAYAYADTVHVTVEAVGLKGATGSVGLSAGEAKQSVSVDVCEGDVFTIYATPDGGSAVLGFFDEDTGFFAEQRSEEFSFIALLDCSIVVYFAPVDKMYCVITAVTESGTEVMQVGAQGDEVSPLPSPVPPAIGLSFVGWASNGGSFRPTSLAGSSGLFPVWSANGSVSGNRVILEEDGNLFISAILDQRFNGSLEGIVSGTPVSVQIELKEEYEIASIEVDGVEAKGSFCVGYPSGSVSFVMPDYDVTIRVTTRLAPARVVYSANGGSGSMAQDEGMPGGTYVLPECDFQAPEGYKFKCWEVMHAGLDAPYQADPGYTLKIGTILHLTAVWEPLAEHVHTFKEVKAADPTCTEPGNELYWKCSECEKCFADKDGKKELDGVPEIPATHTWSDWKVTKKATATSEGQKTRTCSVCGEKETETIPASEGEAVYAPTATVEPWVRGSDEGLTITIERDGDTAGTFAHFLGVSVDGKPVPPLGYTAEEGSLILTLKPAFLETVSAGEHTVTVSFDDGDVDVAFTVTAGKAERSGLPWWAWVLIGVGGLGAAGGGALIALNARAQRQAAARRQAAHRAQYAPRPAVSANPTRRPPANRTAGAGDVSYRDVVSQPDATQQLPRTQASRTGAHTGSHVRVDQTTRLR